MSSFGPAGYVKVPLDMDHVMLDIDFRYVNGHD